MTARHKKAKPGHAAGTPRRTRATKPTARRSDRIGTPPAKSNDKLFGQLDVSNADHDGLQPQTIIGINASLDSTLASLGKNIASQSLRGAAKPTLSDGAIVCMRMSGGISFSSREVSVFADGHVRSKHVEHGNDGAAATELNLDARVLEDMVSLITAETFAPVSIIGNQRPDTYAYELVATVDNKVHDLEVFDGSIPKPVGELITLLKTYLVA